MEENPKRTPQSSTDSGAAGAGAGEEAETRAYEETKAQSEEYEAGEVRAHEEALAREREEAETRAYEEAKAQSEESAAAAGPVLVDDLLRGDAAETAEEEAPPVDLQRASSILESLLLVFSEPLSVEKARQLLGGLTREQFEEVFLLLREKYPPESSGILVEKVAKGVQLRTNPANQEHVRKLFEAKPPRFSRAALETVAIIAYKQPLTRQEIEQIRGVDCAGSLKTLMERRLVRVVGKKDVPGKPFLFGTTREFMEVFGLGSLGDLPSMREIEEYLSSSTATPVDGGRPGLELPFPDADVPGLEEDAEGGELPAESDAGAAVDPDAH